MKIIFSRCYNLRILIFCYLVPKKREFRKLHSTIPSMKRLSRIALESIEVLANPIDLINLGRGVVRCDKWNIKKLVIKLTGKTEELEEKTSIGKASREQFLMRADKYLKDNNLYLTEAEYHPARLGEFIPHRISGNFYSEIKS